MFQGQRRRSRHSREAKRGERGLGIVGENAQQTLADLHHIPVFEKTGLMNLSSLDTRLPLSPLHQNMAPVFLTLDDRVDSRHLFVFQTHVNGKSTPNNYAAVGETKGPLYHIAAKKLDVNLSLRLVRTQPAPPAFYIGSPTGSCVFA